MWYQNAFFDHAHTVTAPGHAIIGTGAHPAVHGIVGNDWIDRGTGRSVGCVADPSSPVVGVETTAGHASPMQLLATTFLEVEDGSLDIRFEPIRGSPKISGIEVIAAGRG